MRKFDHPLPISTFTMRQNSTQFALPVRRNTPTDQVISLGHAVGGMAQHYAGDMGRYGPWAYKWRLRRRAGTAPNFISSFEPNQDVEDWPMTYTDYEPYYVAWEQSWGITGTNEGPLLPMSANYPLPPHPDTALGTAFKNAAEAVGYSPFPTPTALASKPYMNQYGVRSTRASTTDGAQRAATTSARPGRRPTRLQDRPRRDKVRAISPWP